MSSIFFLTFLCKHQTLSNSLAMIFFTIRTFWCLFDDWMLVSVLILVTRCEIAHLLVRMSLEYLRMFIHKQIFKVTVIKLWILSEGLQIQFLQLLLKSSKSLFRTSFECLDIYVNVFVKKTFAYSQGYHDGKTENARASL